MYLCNSETIIYQSKVKVIDNELKKKMEMRKTLFVAAFALCSAFACDVKAQTPTPPVPIHNSENATGEGGWKTNANSVRAPFGSATLLLLSMLGCATGAKLYMNNKRKGE